MNEKNIQPQSEITDEQAMNVYKEDKAEFNNFVKGKAEDVDFSRIQRLVLNELALNKNITPKTICGVTRQQIKLMAQYPERYGDKIIDLMEIMYQKSGYLRRIINYFSDMPKVNYYVDTEVLTPSFFKNKEVSIKNNYIKYCAEASKLNMSNIAHDVFRRLYLNDVCYAFVIENEIDISYFFLNPRYCQITGLVNGNIYKFAINRSMLTDIYIQSFPQELQQLLKDSENISLNNLVDVPLEKGFCIKYNNQFLHLYPAFFPAILSILSIEDFEDLAKTKAVNDAYKLLVLQVPTTKEGKVSMDDRLLSPFIATALRVVNDNIGVLPYPGDVTEIEFDSSRDDDNDTVSNVISQMYSEQGVSEALMSGASSGSELKLSITNDSGDTFRIYRMLENWANLQLKLRGFVYKSYQFVYKIADMTIFNYEDVISEELSLAQASLPNKTRLCAVVGISPSALIGNATMENVFFKTIFDSFIPLKNSYTLSSKDITDEQQSVGAPEKDDDDLSPSGEATRESEGNDPDDRI